MTDDQLMRAAITGAAGAFWMLAIPALKAWYERKRSRRGDRPKLSYRIGYWYGHIRATRKKRSGQLTANR